MKFLKHAIVGLTGIAMAAGAATTASAEFSPRKPIELIIPAGTGGGADQIARLFQAIIQKEDFSPLPVISTGQPVTAWTEGDDHTIMITLNSFYTTPIIQEQLAVDPLNFTPIKLMAIDTFLLWTPADYGINSLDEYVAAVKEKGKAWKMGGTGSGQEDSILTAMLEADLGFDVTYVPFEGGGTRRPVGSARPVHRGAPRGLP